MALTEQQKAENQAARKVRDEAYNTRCRTRRQEIKKAEESPEVLSLSEKADGLNQAMEDRRKHLDSKGEALRAQIAALEKERENLYQDETYQKLSVERREAYGQWNNLKKNLVEAVEERFPDLQGPASMSAAAWTPPQNVVAAMEAARLTAVAKAEPVPVRSKPRSGM